MAKVTGEISAKTIICENFDFAESVWDLLSVINWWKIFS